VLTSSSTWRTRRSYDALAAIAFFATSTRNLLAAESAAGVHQHVVLSIVGAERLTASGYFRGKVVQEDLIRRGTIPYTIVRSTQFFEFVKRIVDEATVENAVRIPPVQFQPIAAEDVAKAVGRVAVSAPVNGIVEIAGPQQFRFDEFIRLGLSARRDPREVVADPHARYFGAEMAERTLVPETDARLGEIRFEDWLSQSAVPAVPAARA
jgi:uncharacterized protein YbjT (DUF2867 family)